MKTSYEQVLVEARQRHNTQAVLELEAIGSPPWAVARQQEDVVWKWAEAFEGGAPSASELLSIALFESPDGLRRSIFSESPTT